MSGRQVPYRRPWPIGYSEVSGCPTSGTVTGSRPEGFTSPNSTRGKWQQSRVVLHQGDRAVGDLLCERQPLWGADRVGNLRLVDIGVLEQSEAEFEAQNSQDRDVDTVLSERSTAYSCE